MKLDRVTSGVKKWFKNASEQDIRILVPVVLFASVGFAIQNFPIINVSEQDIRPFVTVALSMLAGDLIQTIVERKRGKDDNLAVVANVIFFIIVFGSLKIITPNIINVIHLIFALVLILIRVIIPNVEEMQNELDDAEAIHSKVLIYIAYAPVGIFVSLLFFLIFIFSLLGIQL